MQTILLLVLCAAPPMPEQPPLQAAVAEAIRRLGDGAFEVRQQATQTLWSLGPAVVPALQTANQSEHAEVRLRAGRILERFRFGMFAQTPEREIKLINAFRYGDSRARDSAFRKLALRGSADTLLRLLETETSDRLRSQFQDTILRRLESELEIERALSLAETWLAEYGEDVARQKSLRQFMGRQVPYLLATGRVTQAESILERASSTEKGMRDWAVYLSIDGGAEAKVAALREAAAKGSDETTLSQLAYLLRVRGDLAGARDAAQRIETSRESGTSRRNGTSSNPLLRGILFEMRDWQALSDRHDKLFTEDHFGYGRNVEAIGYAAAFHRLAGEGERFDEMVQLLESSVGQADGDDRDKWRRGEALIVNGRVDQGIKILKFEPATAFRMLCLQNRYHEAFSEVAELLDPRGDHSAWFAEVAGQASSRSAEPKGFDLALQVAKVLYQLGEREAAKDYLLTLAEGVQHERDASRLNDVCEVEYELGLVDQAYEHASISLSKGRTAVLGTVFPGSRQATVWWRFFRETGGPESSPESSLSELRRLLSPSDLDRQRFDELAARAEAYAAQLKESRRGNWLYALGETCWMYDRRKLAERFFEQAAESLTDAALRLGDLCMDREQWAQAAEWYDKAWQQNRTKALPLYLRGHALLKTGRREEGQQLMHVARLVPLADSSRRMELAMGLQKRGLRRTAIEQWRLIMRSGRFRVRLDAGFNDATVVDAEKLFANSLQNDLHLKAGHWEAMHLSCLEALLWIPSLRGYLHTPHLVHKTRARAYLAAGEIDDALVEIEQSQRLLPGNSELAEHLVPELEQAGQSEAADKLFEESFAFIENICEQFPNSALHHNNLAWISARCNRRLDDALYHIQRALELVPDSPSYLDTRGEVHFHRGEVQLAIRYAERCLELEPQNKFFREQLKRFQQAE